MEFESYDNDMSIKLPEKWNDWEVEELLGQGAYGCVYKVKKAGYNLVSYGAVKIISISGDSAEMKALSKDYPTREALMEYYAERKNEFLMETKIMNSLRGKPGIVKIEDYHEEEKKDEIGYTIYIRMEYLECFQDYEARTSLNEEEIIRLGIELCKALEICGEYNIIHRDIKLANIFVTANGEYKLGDFGVARQLDKTVGTYSINGSFMYMAPEVAKGLRYGSSVDIYSLGLVLYRLLNKGKMPFIPEDVQRVKYSMNKEAMERRIAGEPLPLPSDASPALGQVVIKACCYDVSERYQKASEFREALEHVLYEIQHPQVRRRPDSKKSWLIPATVMGSILLVGSGWLGLSSVQPPKISVTPVVTPSETSSEIPSETPAKPVMEEDTLNDSFEHALPINLNQENVSHLSSSNKEEYYKFSVTDKGYVQVHLEAKEETNGKAWTIAVFDESEKGIYGESNIVTRSKDDILPLGKGNYYIKVMSAKDYTVTKEEYGISVLSYENDSWEQEPNDMTGNASAVTMEKPFYGNLLTSSDIDCYSFTVDKTGSYQIHFAADNGKTESNGWIYELRDAATKERIGKGKQVVSASDQIYNLEKGNYYLVVRSAKDFGVPVREVYQFVIHPVE